MNQRQHQERGRDGGRQDVHGDDLPSIQVLRRIEADILTGRLSPGSRLAPERELCERMGVARNTLRRALLTLGSRGLIEARGRGGWVVVGPGVTERIEGPPSLTEWASRRGYAVTSRVVVARARAATQGEASDLRVVASSRVFELERVRFVEGVPISLDRSILHPRLIPTLEGTDFASHSLYGTLRDRLGLIPTRAEVVVRALPADTRSSSLLSVTEGHSLLALDETAFDQYDQPFETARLLNRGDRYMFATTFQAGNASPRLEL
jgi:GntR family transcriptional regulator